MIWIDGERTEKRGDIETFNEFLNRNINWWKENIRQERHRRKPYYDFFIEFCGLDKVFSPTRIMAEVGPGPFGGILEVCQVPAKRKFFVDYILRELVNLGFISWPNYATYVTAPAESIPLAADTVDVLVSYNALDHGWDVYQAIRECIRISRKTYLCFDCRGDNDGEVAVRQGGKLDPDHHQLLKFDDMAAFLSREFPKAKLRDTRQKHFPQAVITMEKE